MSRPLACLLAATLLAAACSSGSDEAAEPTTTLAPTTTEPTTTAPPTSEEPTTVAPTTTAEAAPTTVSTVDPGTSPGAPGIGDSLYPDMGNGGYDVQSYALDLTVNVESGSLAGDTTISAIATQELTAFNLDLAGLVVESIRVDGIEADFSRTGDELTVATDEPIAEGTAFETVIAYGGVPRPIDDPAVPFAEVGWRTQERVVFVSSEPSGAKSFFPVNNHPTDRATYTFRITADSALTSAATGILVDTIDNGDATTTTVWEMNDPMASYLAAIYVGDFERRESVTDGGLLIRNYFPTGSADRYEEAFAPTADIISFYENLFGGPYPFDAYGSIVLPFTTGFALENQTLSVHGEGTADTYTIAHEIMHQWAGNSVSLADWQDIWLLEGFATYLPLLYLEQAGLEAPFTPEELHFLLEGGAYDGPAEVDIRDLFGESVYFRGALSLHALRVEVGDELFEEILRTYYERFQGDEITTADFQALVSEVAGDRAQAVLDTWLFGGDLPPYPGPAGG